MKTLFKKLDITGVAVLLLAFFVAVGFKAVDDPNLSGWYEVEIADEEEDQDDPKNQEIGDFLPGGPEGNCDEGDEVLCAVQLDITSGSSLPANMHEADSIPGVSIVTESYKDE